MLIRPAEARAPRLQAAGDMLLALHASVQLIIVLLL